MARACFEMCACILTLAPSPWWPLRRSQRPRTRAGWKVQKARQNQVERTQRQEDRDQMAKALDIMGSMADSIQKLL